MRCAFLAHRDRWETLKMELANLIWDRTAVVAGEVARAQSEANGDDEAGARREASAERFEKGISGGYVPTSCEPPPRAIGNIGNQNRLETSRERSSALCGVESSQSGKPSGTDNFCPPKWQQRKR
jgi:hypothetical protein